MDSASLDNLPPGIIIEDFVYSRIGMALTSAQRVEFITGQLIEYLTELNEFYKGITTAEFLERSTKSKKAIKTLGSIFRLLKLNPKLVIEKELDDYLIKRNLFVHEFWRVYLKDKSKKTVKRAIDFCYDFGHHSDRIESFFKGFLYFLCLRFVANKAELSEGFKKWDKDFDYFMISLEKHKLT